MTTTGNRLYLANQFAPEDDNVPSAVCNHRPTASRDFMTSPYHAGERQMQHLAGLDATADHVARIVQSQLSAGAELFLSFARLVVFAACDAAERCWVIARTGPPGFVRTTPDRVHIIGGLPRRKGALTQLTPGTPVGALAIDMQKRRRFRFNGHVLAADSNGLTIQIEEAYGNCPKYIDPAAYSPPQRPEIFTSSTMDRILTKSKSS